VIALCTSPSIALRSTGNLASAAREMTEAGSTFFSHSLKNGAFSLPLATCCGRACIRAFSRSAGVQVSSVS
jgi:hypothetical protein